MKKLLVPILGIVLCAGIVHAQVTRVYTRPLIPSAETLDKLNLKLSWRRYVPNDGTARDGVATAQIAGPQIFFQMLDGSVVVIHAETGQQLWRTRHGQPYKVTQPLSFNYDTVFIVNGSRIYALERATGRLRWEFDLPNVPTTPPVADSERIYVCITGRQLVTYHLPAADEIPQTIEAYQSRTSRREADKKKGQPPPEQQTSPRTALKERTSIQSSATTPLSAAESVSRYSASTSATKSSQYLAIRFQLNELWLYSTAARMDFPPAVSLRKPDSPGYLLLPSADGRVWGSSKLRRIMVYDWQMDSPLAGPIAQYGDLAYLPNRDGSLIAMNIENGRTLWRSTIGGLAAQQPIVTDEDIYVIPERTGLHRLNRANGDSIWQNPRAIKFISANRKFVYAKDMRGDLLIMDRERGTILATFDICGYNVPIVNDYTDRLYLAAHDGLLVCLHDRDYAAPLANKQLVEEHKPEKKNPDEMKQKPKEEKKE